MPRHQQTLQLALPAPPVPRRMRHQRVPRPRPALRRNRPAVPALVRVRLLRLLVRQPPPAPRPPMHKSVPRQRQVQRVLLPPAPPRPRIRSRRSTTFSIPSMTGFSGPRPPTRAPTTMATLSWQARSTTTRPATRSSSTTARRGSHRRSRRPPQRPTRSIRRTCQAPTRPTVRARPPRRLPVQ